MGINACIDKCMNANAIINVKERGICRARVPHSVWCFLHAASSSGGGSGGGLGSGGGSIYNGSSNRESPGSDKRSTPPEQPTTPKYYLDENDNKVSFLLNYSSHTNTIVSLK